MWPRALGSSIECSSAKEQTSFPTTLALDIFDDDLELDLFGENNLENVILCDCLRTKRRRVLAARHGTFDLASMNEEDGVRQLRSTEEDLPHLRSALLTESIVEEKTEVLRSVSLECHLWMIGAAHP